MQRHELSLRRLLAGVPPVTALAMTALLAAAGCSREAPARAERGLTTEIGAGPGRGADAPPASVRILRIEAAAAGGAILLPGRVKAHDEVTLTATTAARLTELPVAAGQSFERGAALARFEAPEMQRALAAARAGLDAATLHLEQSRRQETRLDSLLGARVAAVREFEVAQAERRTAEAQEAAARSVLEQGLASATLVAPFAGVVVRHRVDAGATVGPGQPLLDIRSAGAGEIEVAVPESDLERVRHAAAAVQIGTEPWCAARLDRLEGMTDFSTRTRLGYLQLAPSGEKRPPDSEALEPGAFARVRFTGFTADGAASSITVPATSLVRRGALAGVYVVEDGRAVLRWLRLGRADGDAVEVLAGLWPGDEVALAPAGLADGLAVRAMP